MGIPNLKHVSHQFWYSPHLLYCDTMPHTKRFYIEITTLKPINNNHFYEVIDKNFEKSFIKLRIFETILYERENHVKQSEQISIVQ